MCAKREDCRTESELHPADASADAGARSPSASSFDIAALLQITCVNQPPGSSFYPVGFRVFIRSDFLPTFGRIRTFQARGLRTFRGHDLLLVCAHAPGSQSANTGWRAAGCGTCGSRGAAPAKKIMAPSTPSTRWRKDRRRINIGPSDGLNGQDVREGVDGHDVRAHADDGAMASGQAKLRNQAEAARGVFPRIRGQLDLEGVELVLGGDEQVDLVAVLVAIVVEMTAPWPLRTRQRT